MTEATRIRLSVTLALAAAASLGAGPDGGQAARETYVDAGGGVRLSYRVVGTGGDPVILVHGGPGFTSDYLADDLAPMARDRALFVYDQRGIGRSTLVSDADGLTAQRYVADLEAIRRHLGLEAITVLGHSWGAAPAALYAMQHPTRVRRMILVGTIPMRGSELRAAFAAMAAGRDAATRDRMAALATIRRANPSDLAACREYYRLWFTPFFATRGAPGSMKGDVCAGSPASLANKPFVDRFTFASLGDWDWTAPLRDVTAPTLVIHGALDPLPIASARQWVAAMPNARLLALEGVGHFPYVEAPDRFFAAVTRFLQGDWPEGASR